MQIHFLLSYSNIWIFLKFLTINYNTKTKIRTFSLFKFLRPLKIKGHLDMYHSIFKTDKIKTGQDLMTYENPNHLKITDMYSRKVPGSSHLLANSFYLSSPLLYPLTHKKRISILDNLK